MIVAPVAVGVTCPPALVVPRSVNQRLPSAPGVISTGLLAGWRPAVSSVIEPAVVIRPIALVVPWSVNQRLPSGPGAIPFGGCRG